MDTVRIPNRDFDLTHTFDCGQCFRWNRENDGSYVGVAGGRVARFSNDGNEIVIENCSRRDYEEFWRVYLDMDRDYGKIKQAVAVNNVMKAAVSYGSGIRILRQDFFETLISYIISQNNSIPNIKRVLERLCAAYGDPITMENKVYYSFPSPEALASLSREDYRALGAGFRDRYLEGAVKLVNDGSLSAEGLMAMSTEDARRELMKVKGVGNKVCDCVMLFALGKYDLFPTDTWIKKVMEESFDQRSASEAKSFGERFFGENSGFAQQYLFYWRRNRE